MPWFVWDSRGGFVEYEAHDSEKSLRHPSCKGLIQFFVRGMPMITPHTTCRTFRIGFFMHSFAGGGAERITVSLANELYRRGNEVIFIVRHDNGPFRDDLDKGVIVFPLAQICDSSSSMGMLLALRKTLIQIKCDVLFPVSLGMAVFAVLAKLISASPTPLIPVIHNTMSQADDRALVFKLRLMRLLDFLVAYTVVVSEDARNDYIKLTGICPSKVITITNPVVSASLEHLAAMPPDHLWFDCDEPVIVAAGRLVAQKNHALMLRSFACLTERRQAKLIILGEGPLRSDLKQLANDLGIVDRVDLHGFVENPYAYFSHAACFLMTSDYEGLPTAMIEALACGCPVVSTDCPSGPREILKDGRYGVLVHDSEPKAIADAVSNTLEGHHPTAVELKIRAQYFAVDTAVDRYLELISEVCR